MMTEEITDEKVQIVSSVQEKLETNSKQCVDDTSIGTTKRTVALQDSSTSENDDMTLSSGRVVMLGIFLLTVGAMGFYYIPGMISTNAKGSKVVNSIYCSVITLTTYVYTMFPFPGVYF